MTPTRPYFLRAIFEWIVDNECTPYLAVNADMLGVNVPREYVENGEITLNISPSAVMDFHMDNEFVLFNARFSGVSHEIIVPIAAVLGVFAKENGQGMAFPEEPAYVESEDSGVVELAAVEKGDGDEESKSAASDEPEPPKPSSPSPGGKGRPQLKVVK